MKRFIFPIIFILFILFTIGFCIKVLLTLDAYSSQINHNEQLVLDLPAKITQLDTAIEELNLKIKALEGVDDANKAGIDNLTKAKDTLFSKVSSLETALEELKVGLSPKVEGPVPVREGTVPAR